MKITDLTKPTSEGVGRIVKNVNTTPDVDTNQLKIEAKKFGFDVSEDGVPPILESYEGDYFMYIGEYEPSVNEEDDSLDNLKWIQIEEDEFFAQHKDNVPNHLKPLLLKNIRVKKTYYKTNNNTMMKIRVESPDEKTREFMFINRKPEVLYDIMDDGNEPKNPVYKWVANKLTGMFNKKKPQKILKPKNESVVSDPIDTVSMDIPLLTRIMELMREETKTDADLHHVLEKMIELSKQKDGALSMDEYARIEQALGNRKGMNESRRANPNLYLFTDGTQYFDLDKIMLEAIRDKIPSHKLHENQHDNNGFQKFLEQYINIPEVGNRYFLCNIRAIPPANLMVLNITKKDYEMLDVNQNYYTIDLDGKPTNWPAKREMNSDLLNWSTTFPDQVAIKSFLTALHMYYPEWEIKYVDTGF